MKKKTYICARSRVDVCMCFTEVMYLERYQAFQPQNADDFPYLGSLHPSKVDTDSEIHHCKLCQWGYARLRGRVSVNRDIQVKNCLFTKQLFFLLQCKRHKHRPGRPAMNTDWVSLDPITRDEILALGNHTHLGRKNRRTNKSTVEELTVWNVSSTITSVLCVKCNILIIALSVTYHYGYFQKGWL